jgi:hypothetical protein
MLSSDKLLKNDLAGEIDSIVKSSPFMGAQKLEHKPQKNNTSLLSNAITLHCMNCKNRYE